MTTFSAFKPSYSLPKNVALLTLQVSWIVFCKYVKDVFISSLHCLILIFQELENGEVLLRLAHLFEVLTRPLCVSTFNVLLLCAFWL